MFIDNDLRYIDTCVLQMFADRKDSLRNEYGIRNNGIESSLLKSRGQLALPMPAFGESICKIRDKCKDRANEVIEEINRLMDEQIIVPRYISNAYDTYELAKKLSETKEDSRDQISPMDALIVATAATDPLCSTLYTSDSRIISDTEVSMIVNQWREQNN